MSFVPIFIHHNSEPSRCPKCGREEDIKETCRHCGYEYEEESGGGFQAFLLVCLITYVVITLLYWGIQVASPPFREESKTLLEVIVSQYEFVVTLFKNII